MEGAGRVSKGLERVFDRAWKALMVAGWESEGAGKDLKGAGRATKGRVVKKGYNRIIPYICTIGHRPLRGCCPKGKLLGRGTSWQVPFRAGFKIDMGKFIDRFHESSFQHSRSFYEPETPAERKQFAVGGGEAVSDGIHEDEKDTDSRVIRWDP